MNTLQINTAVPVTTLTDTENELITRLKALRWSGFAHSIENQFISPAVFAKLSFTDRLLLAVKEHEEYVKANKSAALIKSAKFKGFRTTDEITTDKQRGLSPELFAELCSLSFIRKHHNIMVKGCSGAGKSDLICALGRLCCMNGYSVRYYIVRDLLDLLSCKSLQEKAMFRKRMENVQLLILDDLFLTRLNEEDTSLLNTVLNDRMGRQSTIFASQFADTAFDLCIDANDALSDALLRRIKNVQYNITLAPAEDKHE